MTALTPKVEQIIAQECYEKHLWRERFYELDAEHDSLLQKYSEVSEKFEVLQSITMKNFGTDYTELEKLQEERLNLLEEVITLRKKLEIATAMNLTYQDTEVIDFEGDPGAQDDSTA